jgi:hypothetical protein
MEKFGAMPARSWPPSGMLPNLDVVLQERHYREQFKKLRSPRPAVGKREVRPFALP